MPEQSAGEKALRALQLFYGIASLGDYVYDVRDREGQGWEGPQVTQWSEADKLAREAMKEAGMEAGQ